MKRYSSDKLSIKEWAEEDRPREKLLTKGRSMLTDAELIGILLGSGNQDQSAVDLARDVLRSADNNLNKLAKFNVKELMGFKGIGEAKAIAIVSALELGRRRKSDDIISQPKVTSSVDAYEIIKEQLLDLLHEEFWILLLKRNNELIRKVQISSGGVAGTVADSKIIFKSALDELASAIVLVHNHPSGNLKPSEQDIRLTDRLVKAGKLIDVSVIDHLIVTDSGYFSFADGGRI